MFEARNPLMVV